MVTLARASELLTRMPKQMLVKEVTRRECEVLWDFVHTDNRLSISQQMLKVGLAKECGVMLERIMEVADDSPFIDVLAWEAQEENSDYSLKQAMTVMRNAHLSDDWILPFCQSISHMESAIIWRWALNYRWHSYRNRFIKWLTKHSGLGSEYGLDLHLSVIYDGLKVTESDLQFKRLEPWESGVPDNWWFVSDCGTLKYVGGGVVRNRNGTLNTKFTALLDSDAECWMWENPLGTGHFHTTKDKLPFSSYKNPMADQFVWHESQVLLDSYAKGGFLIAHESKYSSAYKESKKWDYYLLTKGTNVLYAQLLTVRNMDKGGYEFVIGFGDAGEVVDTTTHRMNTLPFALDNALKRRGVRANIRHTFHNIDDCLVAKFNYTWTPDMEWHLKFVDVEESMGLDDVDDILDYMTIVGGEDEP